jgi:hypothetical protein
MEPAKALRFRERASAERVNSNLKDNYGGRFVRVRGAAKVMAHLMFGIIALTAKQLFNMLGTQMSEIQILLLKQDGMRVWASDGNLVCVAF